MLRVFSRIIFVLPALFVLLTGCSKSDEELRKEAQKYFQQAVDYYNREYFSNAKQLFEDVIEIENNLRMKENFGEASLYLGLIFFSEEDYETALNYNQQAKNYFKLNLKRREEGIAENNIGSIFSALGEFKKAEEYYRKAMLICQLAADKEGEADALMNIAQIYFELGDFRNAFQYYSKAFDAYDLIGIQAGKINAAIKMGESQLRFGAYDEAIRSFEFALEFTDSNGTTNYSPEILNLIALSYFKLGDYDRAAQVLEQANLLIEKSETESELNWKVKNNLADVYVKTYHYSKAIENYKSAINTLSEYGEVLPAALLKLKLGLNYLNTFASGDETQINNAVELFEDLCDYFEDIEYPQGEINALAGLAKSYFLKRNIDRSVSICEEIKELITHHPISIKNKLTEQLCLQPDIFRELNVTEFFLSDNKIEEALTFDIQIKENLVNYFISAVHKKDRRISNNDIADEIDFLKFEIMNEASKDAGIKNSTKFSYLNDKLEEKVNQTGYQKKSADKSNISPGITEIKKRLKPNQAFVAYFSVQEKTNVVVVTKGKNQSILLPISKEALSGQVKNLADFLNKNDLISAKEILRGMNTSLFKPVEYLVKDYPSLLFYIAEDLGILNYLPYHALIDQNGKYLSEKYVIEYFGGFQDKRKSTSYGKNIFVSLNAFPHKSKEKEVSFEFWNQSADLKNIIKDSNPGNLILLNPVHLRLAEPSSSYISLSTDSIHSNELDADVYELAQTSSENLFLLNYFDDYTGSAYTSAKTFAYPGVIYLNRLFNEYNKKEQLALAVISQFKKNKDFSVHDFYNQNFSSPGLNWAGLFSYIKI